jgi:hypothetical protein
MSQLHPPKGWGSHKTVYMDEACKNAILTVYKMHQYVKPEFNCTLCKSKINPPTCQGCPIYCQSFNLD